MDMTKVKKIVMPHEKNNMEVELSALERNLTVANTVYAKYTYSPDHLTFIKYATVVFANGEFYWLDMDVMTIIDGVSGSPSISLAIHNFNTYVDENKKMLSVQFYLTGIKNLWRK